MEAPFRLNEFATLAADDLHFLRIFVRCEGRIRDMEAALGLSYPTIRTRLTALKHKLQGAEAVADPTPSPAAPDDTIQAVLNELQAGKITFAEAMEQIQRARSGSSSTQP